MEQWIFALLFLTLIALDAIGDAMRDKKLKTLGGFLEFLLLFILLGTMLFFQTLYWPVTLWPEQCIMLILAYGCFRYALFDVLYNIFRGNIKIFEIGSVKIFDKWHNKIIEWIIRKSWFGRAFTPPKDFFLLFIKLLALILGFIFIKEGF